MPFANLGRLILCFAQRFFCAGRFAAVAAGAALPILAFPILAFPILALPIALPLADAAACAAAFKAAAAAVVGGSMAALAPEIAEVWDGSPTTATNASAAAASTAGEAWGEGDDGDASAIVGSGWGCRLWALGGGSG